MTSSVLIERTRRFSRKSRFTDAQIESIVQAGKPAINRWIIETASQQRITSKANKFARAVSRLSDGIIDLDPVEEILVAMNRAGVISSHQRGLLQIQYLR